MTNSLTVVQFKTGLKTYVARRCVVIKLFTPVNVKKNCACVFTVINRAETVLSLNTLLIAAILKGHS